MEQLRGEVNRLGLESMEDRILTFFKAEHLKDVWTTRKSYLKERNQT